MISDDRMDQTLRALGAPGANVPPLPDILERELADLEPVKLRVPVRQWAIFAAVGLVIAGVLVAALSIRKDLELLPRAWLIAYGGAWLVSFLGLGYLALMPRKGQVSPRCRIAGGAGLVVGALFVVGGLLFARQVPGVSFETPPGVVPLLKHGYSCLTWGLITATGPVILGAMFLRGVIPVSAPWAGAGLGAAGGALGGLMLHMYCHISDPRHMGLIHGGVVVLGALLAAVAVARLARQ